MLETIVNAGVLLLEIIGIIVLAGVGLICIALIVKILVEVLRYKHD